MPKISIAGGTTNRFLEGDEVPETQDLVQVLHEGEVKLVERAHLIDPKRVPRQEPDGEESPEPPAEAPETAEEPADYEAWSKAELVEEIRVRNEERQEAGYGPLSTSGNKEELVARLTGDDTERGDTEQL